MIKRVILVIFSLLVAVTLNADLSRDTNLSKEQIKLYENRLNFIMDPVETFINESAFMQKIDIFLQSFNLSILKFSAILFLVLSVFFIKKFAFIFLEKYLVKVDHLRSYSQEILAAQKSPIEALLVLITLNMTLYIFNDFNLDKDISTLFNIFYVFVSTLMLYRLINTIAGIKLSSVYDSDVKMKNDLINIGIKILNSIVVVIGLLIILFFAGVNLTAVLSGLGIGGIAVAFAAKDTISNFFGTISILVSDVFSQGDWIEVGGKEGVVVEIGLRVTTLRTFDNALIAIPNGTVANADVKNWSKRTLGRRIRMSIGVKYSSTSQDLKNAVNEIRGMLDKHKGIATENTLYEHLHENAAKLVSKDDLEGVKKTLLVHLDEFGPSSINILIYCFSKTVVWSEWLETKEDVMHKIMEILKQNNLEFAFPSLSIYSEEQRDKMNISSKRDNFLD